MTALLSPDRLIAVRTPSIVLPVIGLVGGLGLGALSAYRLAYGVVALVVAILAVVTIYRPANLAILAVAGVFAVQRVGSSSYQPGSSGGISYSDALLAAATVLAIPAVAASRELGRLRVALVGLGIYLSCLLPTVLLHASSRGYLEWTHRLVLIGGSLVVGAWIVREGLIRIALRCLLIVACFVALAAVESSISSGFAPAFPFGLHKNFVGALFAVVVVVVAIAPEHFGLTPRRQAIALLLLAAGLLASQSRGAMLSTVAGLLVAFALDPRGHSRRLRAVAVFVALVLAAFSFISIRDQLKQTQADALNGSIGVRFNVEKVTREVWRTSPVTGVGLKYYNTGHFGRSAVAANNDVDNELAESGVVGLIGFILLQGFTSAAVVRRKRDGKLIAAALGAVTAHLLHGMVDIYWSGGVVTLPFLVLGMALATDEPVGPDAKPAGRTASTRPE